MNKNEILAARIDEVMYESPWYGSNVNDLLSKITASQAIQRVNGQHNIAELLHHMIQWKRFVYEKTFGDKTFDIVDNAINWKVFDALSEGEWAAMNLEYISVTSDLVNGLNNLSLSIYAKTVPGRKYNYEHLLYGIVDHDIYHLGQIALMQKMIV